jgi:hypothetical protein
MIARILSPRCRTGQMQGTMRARSSGEGGSSRHLSGDCGSMAHCPKNANRLPEKVAHHSACVICAFTSALPASTV